MESPLAVGGALEKIIHELQVHQIELEIQNEELRRTRLALEDSRDKYLDLYEFAPIGYLTLTKNAMIDGANLTATTLLGVGRRDLINDRFRRFVVPEDLEQWDRFFISVLRSADKLTCELRCKTSNNTPFYARLDCIRMKMGVGDPLIRMAISDITAQKQAEEAINLLSEERKVLIDNMPAMIWYKDTHNNFIRVNPAASRTFGRSATAIEGKSAYDLFPETAEQYFRDDLEVISSGTPKFGIIEQMKTADGRDLWLRTEKIPLKDKDGTIAGVLVFSVDITDIKREED